MRTTDGGVSCYFQHQAGIPINNAGQIGQNYDLRFSSPTNGIIVGDTGFVGRTSDGGVTITPVTSGVPTNQALSVDLVRRCEHRIRRCWSSKRVSRDNHQNHRWRRNLDNRLHDYESCYVVGSD